MNLLKTMLASSFWLFLSPLAMAHDNAVTQGFLAGLVHPLTGLDHLFALLMCGIIAVSFKKHQLKVISGFMGTLLIGALAGMLLGANHLIEMLIFISLPSLILLNYLKQSSKNNDSPYLVFSLTSSLLIAHGWAHGIVAQQINISFIAGFLFSSALLMLTTAYFYSQYRQNPTLHVQS